MEGEARLSSAIRLTLTRFDPDLIRRPNAYRWSVEISVYVDPDHQGQGVGRLLYQDLLDLLRQQGYINVYAGVSLPNPASEALHRAVGMRLMGVFPKAGFKRGRWWHVAWYGMRLHRGEGEPSEPIALPELE